MGPEPRPDAPREPELRGLTAGQIAANHMQGYEQEFSLRVRANDNGGEWREALFVERCLACGHAMVYANHGIFNLSKVLASDARGDPILLSFISAWGKRIGLNIGMEGKTGERVYGPGSITLAGAAYHDYGTLGLVLTAAVLGMLFGQSILWIQSKGVYGFAGVLLFTCMFYVFLLSSIFVGFSVLPFPFIASGIGVSFLVWTLMCGTLSKPNE